MLVAATAERERPTSTTALRRASGSICGTNRREERPGRVPNRDGGGHGNVHPEPRWRLSVPHSRRPPPARLVVAAAEREEGAPLALAATLLEEPAARPSAAGGCSLPPARWERAQAPPRVLSTGSTCRPFSTFYGWAHFRLFLRIRAREEADPNVSSSVRYYSFSDCFLVCTLLFHCTYGATVSSSQPNTGIFAKNIFNISSNTGAFL